MIEYLAVGAGLFAAFKLGQLYQKHLWLNDIVEDTPHWRGLIELVEKEKARMTPEERATLGERMGPPTGDPIREPINIEQHGNTYYAFTTQDEFLAQGPSLEDLAQAIERRRPGLYQTDLANLNR